MVPSSRCDPVQPESRAVTECIQTPVEGLHDLETTVDQICVCPVEGPGTNFSQVMFLIGLVNQVSHISGNSIELPLEQSAARWQTFTSCSVMNLFKCAKKR
ncbi:hypothetical protein RRG08_063359 [Elysia crispata]|uniref:Uncharacterized protein n=1 Tax=Elysia crispata TaxID=231223 RepID=A0AAE1E9D9_9GAST|nr:hypothetical protein RRG08_063359 [Elysia crispata]